MGSNPARDPSRSHKRPDRSALPYPGPEPNNAFGGAALTARVWNERVNAPDFSPGLDWLNTERPLSLADLRGKLVILDFWTYC